MQHCARFRHALLYMRAHVQENIRSHKPNFIGALTAANLVVDLHELNALDEDTGHFLCGILNTEQRFENRQLKFIANKVFEILTERVRRSLLSASPWRCTGAAAASGHPCCARLN